MQMDMPEWTESCDERINELLIEETETPEKCIYKQIATRNSEESPISSVYNSLSPLPQTKVKHITEMMHPLNFKSPPSVFKSPEDNSLVQSSYLRRHQFPDPSKPKISSNGGNENDTNKVNAGVPMNLDEHKENLDPRVSNSEVPCVPNYDYSQQNFAENFSYCDYNQNCSGPLMYSTKDNLAEFGHIYQSTEDFCGFSNDFFVCEPQNHINSSEVTVDPSARYYMSIQNAILNEQNLRTTVSGEDFGDTSVNRSMSMQPEEGTEMMGNSVLHGVNDGSSISNSGQNVDYKILSGLCRTVRRRALFNSHHDQTSFDQQMVPKKTENDLSRVLAGTGLLLNSLPTNYCASSFGRLSTVPNPFAHFGLSNYRQQLLTTTSAEYSFVGRGTDAFSNPAGPTENEETNTMENEEINASSPRKRPRLEQSVAGESCKRCKCVKSKCLKLYCECFAHGTYCTGPCACVNCHNTSAHADMVIATRKQIESRNPLAFAPKVIRGSHVKSEPRDDISNTPASDRHKRGCNCKKSGCLKKYCECYEGKVGCSINCRCEGCKNVYGRKDSSALGKNHEFVVNETDTSALGKNHEFVVNETDTSALGKNHKFVVNETDTSAAEAERHTVELASSTERSPSLVCPPAPPPPKFNECSETNKDEQMPGILQGRAPISGVHSPNRKRVTPPKNSETSESGLRGSSRRNILQSISAFPALGNED